jgi:hypothetical protein
MMKYKLKSTTRSTRTPAPNSTYPKVAVQWLNQALCFYQNFCLVDSEVLRNRHLRVAAKRCGIYFSDATVNIDKNEPRKKFYRQNQK